MGCNARQQQKKTLSLMCLIGGGVGPIGGHFNIVYLAIDCDNNQSL